MSKSLERLEALQRIYTNLSAETGQSEDLAVGAGLGVKAKGVQEAAGARSVSEAASRYMSVSVTDAAKTPGVPTGSTGVPAIDEPASELNVRKNLEQLLLMLKIETDEKQTETRAAMMEQSEEAIANRTETLLRQIEETMEEMTKASELSDIIKYVGWAVTALSTLAAVATLGASLAATVAANGAATAVTMAGTAGAVTADTLSASSGVAVKMGLNIGKAAVEKTVRKTVAKELVQTTAEKIASEVARRMAEVSAKQVASAALREGLKSTLAASLTLGFQALNESGKTGEWGEKISEGFGDENGTSGAIVMGGLQLGLTLGLGFALNSTALSAATKGLGAVGTAKVAGGCLVGGLGVAQSGLGIYNGRVQYDANMSEAKTTELKSALARLRQMLDEQQEELSEIIANLQDTLSSAFAIIDSQNQAAKKISENLSDMV